MLFLSKNFYTKHSSKSSINKLHFCHGHLFHSILLMGFTLCFYPLAFADTPIAKEQVAPIQGTLTQSTSTQITPICSEVISTQEGLLKGYSQVSRRGNTVCAYRGIPYAKPPIGELRWKAPQPLPKREKLLIADTFKDDCMQNMQQADFIEESSAEAMSEDCLGLNIWRPSKPGKYPVMVWIHGGSLVLGSSAWPTYDGANLADQQDVVVVTLNYRLNMFGFLSHEALVDINDGYQGGSAGNYGILDQLMALQWVQNNIENFSGDANNVTIFGESAGAWSVFTHLVSPLSKNLFHKAIAQSGGTEASLTNAVAFREGAKLGEKTGCLKDGISHIGLAECLRNVPAEELYSIGGEVSFSCRSNTKMGIPMCYLPREDGVVLPDMPYELIKQGRYTNVPFLTGYNSVDLPFLTRSTKETIAAMEGHPSYLYEFRYKVHALDFIRSGFHGVELSYVFDTRLDRAPFRHDKDNMKDAQPFINQLQSYWGNFAKTGNPNGKTFEENDLLEWPKYKINNEELGSNKMSPIKNILMLKNTIKVKSL